MNFLIVTVDVILCERPTTTDLYVLSSSVHLVPAPCYVSHPSQLICHPLCQLEIPKQLFDPNVFNAWMILFLNILERPVPAEGQPEDPELRKTWGWWKVKKWTVHILNRLYTR